MRAYKGSASHFKSFLYYLSGDREGLPSTPDDGKSV